MGPQRFHHLGQITEKSDMATVTHAHQRCDAQSALTPSSPKNKPQLYLHPMSRWRLYFRFDSPEHSSGRIRFVGFTVVSDCFVCCGLYNVMNLADGPDPKKRAKEVGILQVHRLGRKQLVSQFFSESLLVTLFSLLLFPRAIAVRPSIVNTMAEKTDADSVE